MQALAALCGVSDSAPTAYVRSIASRYRIPGKLDVDEVVSEGLLLAGQILYKYPRLRSSPGEFQRVLGRLLPQRVRKLYEKLRAVRRDAKREVSLSALGVDGEGGKLSMELEDRSSSSFRAEHVQAVVEFEDVVSVICRRLTGDTLVLWYTIIPGSAPMRFQVKQLAKELGWTLKKVQYHLQKLTDTVSSVLHGKASARSSRSQKATGVAEELLSSGAPVTVKGIDVGSPDVVLQGPTVELRFERPKRMVWSSDLQSLSRAEKCCVTSRGWEILWS